MLKMIHDYNYLSTVRIHDRDLKSPVWEEKECNFQGLASANGQPTRSQCLMTIKLGCKYV